MRIQTKLYLKSKKKLTNQTPSKRIFPALQIGKLSYRRMFIKNVYNFEAKKEKTKNE